MQKHEIWSISADRIRDFFLTQNEIRQDGEAFVCGECRIRVLPLPERQLGRFRFPQTQVDFEGPEADTEQIHRRFVLQFISAGG